MADITKIGWTHSTFNAWIGCTKVGPGCDNCYAEAQDARKIWGGSRHWGAGVPRFLTSKSNWRKPFLWNEQAARTGQRHLVFGGSLCDPFDNEVHPEWRVSYFKLIEATPHLTWQLVTKRISNVPRMILEATNGAWEGKGFPKNLWIGATVVNQEEFDRDVPKLERIPATVRFLSVEPQVGRIDTCKAFGMWWNQTMNCFEGTGREFKRPFDWLICGGESLQHGVCRPFDVEWARTLARTCKAAGVPFFMKQLGHKAHDFGCGELKYTGKGDDPNEWPEEIRVREFPA